jgi:hypothetical protein
VGVILFGIITALAATPGRAHHGPTQGSQSRYAAFMLPHWCAIWLLLWDRVSRSTWPRARQAIAALALLATIALSPLHVLTAIVWRAKADNVSTAGLALQSGVEDDGWLRTLHPSPIVVSTTVARLRAAGDPAWQLPALNAGAEEVRALDVCASGFVALPLTRAGDYELRSSLETTGDRGFVIDGEGKVIGLARVAPLVSGTEPSHRDVISAVLRDLRRKTTRQWLGFAHSTPSAPAAVIIERKAMLVCRAVVSGS